VPNRDYIKLASAALVATGSLLLLSTSVKAQTQGGPPPRVFAAANILQLKRVAGAQISPDGRWIIFTQSADDLKTDRIQSTLWIVPSTGGPPRPLTAGPARDPRWSSDSDHIAYLADDIGGKSQIQVTSVATRAHAEITSSDISPNNIAWSPDGRTIAFTAFVAEPAQALAAPISAPAGATWASPLPFTTAKHVVADGSGYIRPGHNHLFTVAASGGPPRQLTTGSSEDASPAWSPDGRDLVYSSHDGAAAGLDFALDRVWTVNVATGTTTRLSPDPIDAVHPVVSPDGRHIAFIGWVSPHPGDFFPIDVYVMDRDGSHAHVLDPALDRIASSPQWTSDGQAILFHYEDQGASKIGRAGLDGSFSVLAEGVVDQFSASRFGVLAFPLGAADHPADLGVAQAGMVRRLTHLNDPLLSTLRLATLKPLPVRSSFDGAAVGAWTLLPPGYDPRRRYPTILEIHGGPYGEDDPYWRTDSQVFAGAGYVVLYANYRGSTSYGLKFSTAIDRKFPGAAPYDDLMSAVDAAVAAGVADPSRLYVTGGSAGGQLTTWIVGRTHRFRAAAALKPITDEISEALDTDQYVYEATSEYATTPWADPMLFWRHSSLSLAGDVSTPTLLMVGEDDRRTPIGQSLAFYNALQILGVPTGLVVVPGASHEGLKSRPSQRAQEDLDILAWFARYSGATASAR
jgi:dipeptidyl aminopeptidase/acylaminoacyl peptidase